MRSSRPHWRRSHRRFHLADAGDALRIFAGGEAFVLWVNRIQEDRFEDANRLFIPPEQANVIVEPQGTPEFWAEQVMHKVRPIFDCRKPTALIVGRYQPFHGGHKALIIEALKRVGQVCIAIRDTRGTDDKNPFSCVDGPAWQGIFWRAAQGSLAVMCPAC